MKRSKIPSLMNLLATLTSTMALGLSCGAFASSVELVTPRCANVGEEIVVSLKIIGALLVEALVLVPAAAARNIATSTRGYLVWSVVVAFLAGIGGLGVSTRLLVPTGGAVVLAVSTIFFVTLAIARLRTRRVS